MYTGALLLSSLRLLDRLPDLRPAPCCCSVCVFLGCFFCAFFRNSIPPPLGRLGRKASRLGDPHPRHRHASPWPVGPPGIVRVGGVLLCEISTRCRCKCSLNSVLADLLRPGTFSLSREPVSPWSCWQVRVDPYHVFFKCALGVVHGWFGEVSPSNRSARR